MDAKTFLNATAILCSGTLIAAILNAYHAGNVNVKNSLMKFSFLTALGYIFRIFTYKGIICLYIGQFLIGYANAFHLNVRMRLFQRWFAPESIKPLFTIIINVMYIGKGLFTISPYLFVNEQTQTLEEQQRGIFIFYSIWTAITLASIAWTYLKFIENPPAGYGSAVSSEDDSFQILSVKHFLIEIHNLCSTPLYMKYLTMTTFAVAGLVNISDVLNIAVINFGYTQVDGSWTLFYFNIWGLIGALIYDKYFHHLKQEKKFLVIYTYCGLVN